jgi:hypothetical protein
MTKAIIIAGKTCGITTAPRDDKQYLGRPETVQMLEENSLRRDRFDVSESHYLAWSLGVVCGVRPGSIGAAKGKKEGKKFPNGLILPSLEALDLGVSTFSSSSGF